MRVPLSWLADHVELSDLSAEEVADRLSLSGTAVEAIERRGLPAGDDNLAAFRVGQVVAVEPHPNADRLRVCRVDVGDGAPLQIVCGAPNVAAGQLVPVALAGAVMPGGTRLARAKLRGVESNGMICSALELELGVEADGIMVLARGAEPGALLVDVVPGLAETVLEVELTSNRPDCAAVAGVGRELAAVLARDFRPADESDPPADGPGRIEDLVGLRVEAPDLCPRYMARAFVAVAVGPSPAWLRGRIEAAGMRAISNVVDVTNYAMLLTGQPLHAFDLDRMAGPEVVVRRAAAGERVITLDEVERTLDDSMLAICDAERPAVIAGIMGAAEVEVGPETTRVLLEAANFSGPSILNTSLALGLRSESSGRFEKGLAPELAEAGLRIASRLLVELCGAAMVPGTLDARVAIPDREPIVLRHARTSLVLGEAVPPVEAADILQRLGCEVEAGADAHVVRPPYWRSGDLTREADLIEEIGRVRGYDRIPARLPRIAGRGRRTPLQELRERLARRCADLGISQAITYSMVAEADADLLGMAAGDPRREVVRLRHPLTEDMAVMRRSMLPGLLRAAARNQAHQSPAGALFELGRTYAPAAESLADEREWLAILWFGEPPRAHWRAAPAPVDFFAAKGVIENLAAIAGVEIAAHPNEAPYFHPGRQARMQAGDAVIGWVGEVHPTVLDRFAVRGPAAAMVLDVAALASARSAERVRFEELLTVPASTRDLALLVGDDVPAARLPEVARAAAPLVRHAEVFDRYAGEQVPQGKVSLALRLVIADPGRTLTDEEIEAQVSAAAAALRGDLGAERRR